RLPDLVAFAQKHNLKIGTISDLIAYRRRHDNLIREVERGSVTSMVGGEWEIRVFRDAPEGAEHYALLKGDVETGGAVLTRMHVLDPLEDVIALNPGRWQQVPDAMEAIAQEGRGAVVILRDASANAVSERLRPRSASPKELRQYGVGAQILASLGISEMIMLTNSPAPKLVGLEGYDLTITGTRTFGMREN
ncbi:MAG: 3,4-dihydroxy-2-butanone-4-phosphate synthase, partial [Pseudomonadota bacterium]